MNINSFSFINSTSLFRIILFLFLIPIIVSCTKTENIHFHGRVTFNCDQIPIGNSNVRITRYFDNGTNDADFITECTTDNNGYYSATAEVKQIGNFMGYRMQVRNEVNNSPFLVYEEDFGSLNNSSDIEVNCPITPKRAYSFHIKNISPYNNSDIFNALKISFLDSSYINRIIISDLQGMSVDTIFYFFLNQYSLCYSAYSTKNGVQTVTPIDTIYNQGGCLDTLQTEINY